MKLPRLAACLLLAGCATPISGNPIQDVVSATPGAAGANAALAQQFQDAAWNLDQAVAVGALDKDDPAPSCVHSILTDMGLEGPPAPSFIPRNKGLVAQGSILYIRAQQLKKLQGGGIQVPVSCDAIIGRFVRDAAKAAVQIGSSFIPIPKLPGLP